eukprot:gene3964-4336_t
MKTKKLPKYRGRLAPSPSGHLHVGHAQTFWIAQERARLRHGDLVMRVEDIDIARCKSIYTSEMMEDLTWFGVHWNQGYGVSSSSSSSLTTSSSSTMTNTTKYLQSQRFPIYEYAWKILYEKGYLYPCKLSRKDVETALSAPHDNNTQVHHPSTISNNDTNNNNNEIVFPPSLRPDFMHSIPYEVGSNEHLPPTWQDLSSPSEVRVNWRFRVPDADSLEAKIGFVDTCKGSQSFEAGKDFGDFLVWRLDGYPSYELAVVVDDVLMGITEVVRGEDLLLSTARQLLLMKAIFGLDYKDDRLWHDLPSLPGIVEGTTEVGEDSKEESNTSTTPIALRNALSTLEEQGSHPSVNSNVVDEDIGTLFNPTALSQYLIPRYFHSPLVCDENGVRLAKRNFAKSLRKLREEGLTPEEIRGSFMAQIDEKLFV